MAISFDESRKIFTIDTINTRYTFQIVYGKFPVHLYYGNKETAPDGEFVCKPFSFSPFYKEYHVSYLPDYCLGEYNGFDSGDYRAYSLKIKNGNGDSCTVLKYQSYRIFKGRLELVGLPNADIDDNTETLELTLFDEVTDICVKLYYTVYSEDDVISRYVTITNNGKETVTIEKCMSLMLDLPDCNYDMISLYGGTQNERKYQRVPLHHGSQSIFSRRGFSSPHFNPFIALCETDATQTKGNVYGFNFVFSGNFLDEVEVDQHNFTRVQIGLGSDNFSWGLNSNETFVSPEAVMTFSSCGIDRMTRNFHRFTRKYILPAEPFETRPVVINPWEAVRFDIDEKLMLEFAKSAKETGIDMLVMDDGWFGERNSSFAGLGDWFVNKDKFKNGLKSFVLKVKEYGIKFGIWIEPEMINEDSNLFRAHPEWCLRCKDREMMESRNQLVLDMGNPEVLKYLKETFTETFKDIPIDYFKWDANRHSSQVGSMNLPKEQQGETAHRYMLGVYDLLDWFRRQYPNAMMETCSSGGGRYDLGMMKYGSMIWTSDNTKPHSRIKIQYGSMIAYPAATMSCHVTEHTECEDPKKLNYRWQVAMGGALGYELLLPKASKTLKENIKQQIKIYHNYEDLILRGDYYSLLNPFETNYNAYYFADEGYERILLTFLQVDAEKPKEILLKVPETEENAKYIDEFSGIEYSGKNLCDGISVMTEDSDCNSKMWAFKKII